MARRLARAVPAVFGRRADTRPKVTARTGRGDWYRISNHDADTAELYIYDEIGIWGITASDLLNDLAQVTAGTINVRINSPGGEVFDGIAIYNALLSHPATVNTTVDSLAASAASFIAQAGETVTMAPHSQMMIHDAMGLAVGNAATMRELATLLDRQSDNIALIYADRAGGTVASWRAAMQAESWYTPQEAVDAGLADVVGAKPSRDDGEPENRWDLSIFNYQGRDAAPAPYIPGQDDPAGPVFEFDPEAFRAAIHGVPDIPPAQPDPPANYADLIRRALKEAYA